MICTRLCVHLNLAVFPACTHNDNYEVLHEFDDAPFYSFLVNTITT
jgi:hypothetical protein